MVDRHSSATFNPSTPFLGAAHSFFLVAVETVDLGKERSADKGEIGGAQEHPGSAMDQAFKGDGAESGHRVLACWRSELGHSGHA